MKRTALLPIGAGVLAGVLAGLAVSARPAFDPPEHFPVLDPVETPAAPTPAVTETATFGAGCFWCVEAVFQRIKGVKTVTSGYSGGHVPNPTYLDVCGGRTGHAEVVQVTFDPRKISFREVLEVFFSTHDPTTLNRQGNDVGTQYRSAIFYHSDEQQRVAAELISELNEARAYARPIVTEVTPFERFYAAEDYHQEYFARNGGQPYCQFVVAPKVSKFKKQYSSRLKA